MCQLFQVNVPSNCLVALFSRFLREDLPGKMMHYELASSKTKPKLKEVGFRDRGLLVLALKHYALEPLGNLPNIQ